MLNEDFFRYSTRRLKYIAEFYDEFCPNKYLSKDWESVIEQKCDFDRAVGQLNKVEHNLVFDIYTWKIDQRNEVFRKMRRYLNGQE